MIGYKKCDELCFVALTLEAKAQGCDKLAFRQHAFYQVLLDKRGGEMSQDMKDQLNKWYPMQDRIR